MECPACGEMIPDDSRYCDQCGAELMIRPDDQADTVRKRLEVYHQQTQPLIDYYKEKGLVVDVDGTQPMDVVFQAIVQCLGE